jgi:small subunit ribosomal protein S17
MSDSTSTPSTPSDTATAAAKADDRGSRRVIVGTVTSNTMDKTATVTVIRRVRDRRFHKFLTRRMKYHVHDEHNATKVGDVVEIVESRPMSKTKRWRLLSTLSRAVEAEPHVRPQGDNPQVEK